ncbi:RNA-directed DNA polymerase, eukaryota [Tanacetum coccineum]
MTIEDIRLQDHTYGLRYGSVFNVQSATAFNNFISLESLIDLPLDGYAYTWVHKSANKMSKLDRFLISEGLMASFPHLLALYFEKIIDQCGSNEAIINDISILLKELQDIISMESETIKAIHGEKGTLGSLDTRPRRSPWLEIVREINILWSKVWSYRHDPRGCIEEEHQCMLLSRISGVILPNMLDRWVWSLEASGEFLVKSTRSLIDDSHLPKEDVHTRWVKVVLLKINVFAWRVRLDKVRTRLNLSLRGVEISSIMCPLCNSSVESASHLFFSCHVARLIWKKVLRWWDLEENMIDSYDDWLLLLKNIRLSKRLKDIFEGVCYVKWWLIWSFRNQVLFGDKHRPKDMLFHDLVNLSFQWCSSRCTSKLN